jgi:predicted permease
MTSDYVRSARRSLAKHPFFSAVIVLSLGLAIGANAAIFSLIDAALLRPVDLPQADRLVNVYTTDSAGAGFQSSSYPDYVAMRDNARGVTGVFGYSGLMTTITGGKPEVVFGELVTGNYFAVSGARIALGRAFLPDEDRVPGAEPVVVISHRLWQRRFAGDSSIVGKAITLNGHPFTVVGVAAPEVTGLLFRGVSSDLWAPTMMMGQLRTDQLRNRDERWMFVKARLAPDATVEQVSRSFTSVATALARAFPQSNRGRGFILRSMNDVAVNPDGDRFVLPGAAIVMMAVGLVVLIAAANVANLMLARATSRSREIAIRLALGATRRQIVAQLLAESGLLAALGGVVGLALAYGFARLIVVFQPPIPVPVSLHVGIDARVVAFTVLLTGFSAIIFGLLPALQASKPSLTGALKGARDDLGRRSRVMRLRGILLVPQLTLSLVLLVIAGLCARSVLKAGTVDAGFDIDRTAMLALSLNLDGYDSTRAATFYTDLTRRLTSRPGVQSLTVTDRIPLDLYGSQSAIVSLPGTNDGGERVVQTAGIDADYFSTLGISLVAGRPFTAAEIQSAAPVAIVSEAMARRFWPTQNAVGRILRDASGTPLEIVGVARDTKVQTLGEAPTPLLYRPLDTRYSRLLRVIVRSSMPPERVVGTLQREVAALDPNVAIFESGTMSSHLGIMLFPYRAGATISALLGGFGLLLSSIGLFGVVSFSVARRTRELGIRLAIGATPSMVMRMVILEQARVIGISIALGLLISLGAARALQSVVFGISWVDPITFVAVVVTLASVALVASCLPALRATRISPVVALREE